MCDRFRIFSLMAVIMVSLASTENIQFQKLDPRTYPTLYGFHSSRNRQNGENTFKGHIRNIQGKVKPILESTRGRQQISGYYNPYNTHYNNNNKYANYPYQSSKRLTSQYQNRYTQPKRKQDFGIESRQRRPRPTRRTNVTPKKLKPLLALM